jgi:sugar O-acyltransferase (sialic acid O-acetyltransferase NeuD family)
MTEELVFIGAGAHLSVAAEVARLNRMVIAGLLDREFRVGGERFGIKVLGDDSLIEQLAKKAVFHIAITEPAIRKKLRAQIESHGGQIVRLVHPRAVVSDDAELSDGCFVAAGAIVNPCAKLSAGIVVNTGAQIDHDCQIGPDCHIAPGAILAGNVTCGEATFIASGAIIAPNIRIGRGCVVGAGSVVLEDVPDGARVLGNPARAKV